MSFHVDNGMGDSEDDPSPRRRKKLLAKLDELDDEHGEVWLSHESGWTLSVNKASLLIWQNIEAGSEEHHMLDVSGDRVLELWSMLADGRIEELAVLDWRPGLPPPDEVAVAEAHTFMQERDRQWVKDLGPESTTESCIEPGCTRGRMRLSMLCAKHHFENLHKRPFPSDA